MPEPPRSATPLEGMIGRLAAHHGATGPPPCRGPFEMVLWEMAAYLASDERRAEAFAALRERVGLTPAAILRAAPGALEDIARLGGSIAAPERAARMRAAAQRVADEFAGDLESALRLPAAKAKRVLMGFPMIGEPGAEKILLFCGVLPVLALESNGLRVLTRTGIAAEGKSYAAAYRAAREATLAQLPPDCALLQSAHLLLRRHGKEVCRQNGPSCAICPLRADCRWHSGRAGG